MNSIKNLSKPHLYKSERSYQTTPRTKGSKTMADLKVNDINSNSNADEYVLRKTKSNVTIRNNANYYVGRNNENEQMKSIDIRNHDYPQTPQQETKAYSINKNNPNTNGNRKYLSNDSRQFGFNDHYNKMTVGHNKNNQDDCIGINDLDMNDKNNNSNNEQHTPKYYDNTNYYHKHHNRNNNLNSNHFNHNSSRPLSHQVHDRNATKKEASDKTNQMPVNNNNKDNDKGALCVRIVQELIDLYSSRTNEVIKPEELSNRIKYDVFNNKAKDDFINSVYRLYLTTIPSDNKKKTDISDLWEWIQANHLNNEINIREARNNNDVYKDYYEGIMEEYDLRSFEEMKEFLDELLMKNNKNEKFVEGMKKILCKDIGRRKKCCNLSSSNTTNNNTYAN